MADNHPHDLLQSVHSSRFYNFDLLLQNVIIVVLVMPYYPIPDTLSLFCTTNIHSALTAWIPLIKHSLVKMGLIFFHHIALVPSDSV